MYGTWASQHSSNIILIQIHRISKISTAYERRVNEVRDRILKLMSEYRNVVIGMIDEEYNQIERIKVNKKQIERQNQKYKTKMVEELIKKSEQNVNQINIYKEQIINQLNKINDLGNSFQSLDNDLEIVGTHFKIIRQLKQCIDRVSICLSRQAGLTPLPKQLTDLRVQLNKLQAYEQLYIIKISQLSQTMKTTKRQLKLLKNPNIPYDKLLDELQINIRNNSDHNVCHFCGQTFTFGSVNSQCLHNIQIRVKQFNGYCSPNPDIGKFSTRRHYFGKPKQIWSHLRDPAGSFKVHLDALTVKLKTLMLINKVNLQKQFKKLDKQKTGFCQKIVFDYLLIQQCKLNDDQAFIIKEYCRKDKNIDSYEYSRIIGLLENFSLEIE